jgi:PAS domain S-box-containing protein
MSAEGTTPVEPPNGELRRDRSLIADLDAIVWEADARTMTFTFVSEGVREILGYTEHEWLADPRFWVDHLHPEDRELATSRFARAATSGARFDSEYRFFAKDGSIVWLRDLGHAVKDVDGHPLLIRGLMTEISERKSLERERADAERRFRRVVERLPAIVYLERAESDPAKLGIMLYVSPQVESILGFAPKEWIADPTARARQFHPEDRERVHRGDQEAERSGEPVSAEYRMFARDGRIVWFRDDAVLVRDEDGDPAYWQGIMYDITSLRQGEQQIRQAEAQRAEAEERYRALIEQNPTITYIDAVEGPVTTLYISPQTTDVLGYTPQDWYDAPQLWTEIVHPEDRERSKVGSSDRTHDAVYRMIARDGRTVWIHDQARLISDEAGRPKYWQGVLVDITEQRRAEELSRDLTSEREATDRLRAADEIKNTFLQAVSHDLRTPLAAILGLAVTLEREDLNLDTDETRDMAGRIAQNARKLDGIVSDLLDLDRLSRGILEPFFETVDVGSLVREMAANFELSTGRRLYLHTEPAEVPADVAMVERIVENLLGNAAKHTPPDARIWVRVTGNDDGALIVVEDDGPGVPAGERESIFEDFRQGSEHASGAGVGLALVARFAALHDGRTWVEDRPDGGASFHVFLSSHPVAIRRDMGADEAGPDDGRRTTA